MNVVISTFLKLCHDHLERSEGENSEGMDIPCDASWLQNHQHGRIGSCFSKEIFGQ